jgi:hypothetical protein
VHLRRKHDDIGEPIEIMPSRMQYASRLVPEIPLPHSFVSAHARKNSSPFEIINESMRGACEYIRLLDEIAPPRQTSQDSFGWYSPVSNTTPYKFDHQFLKYVDFGYESYICPECLINDALPFGGVTGSDEIIRTEHRCNQKRLVEIERFTEDVKTAELARLRTSIPETMRKAINKLWTEGRNLYLIAVKIPYVSSTSYNFTNLYKQDCAWLHEAIEGKTISLDDDQLKEFLSYSQGNSYVSFCITIRLGGFEIIESYFMTLSKEPFLFAQFYIENPKVLALQVPNHYYTLGNLALIGKLVLWSLWDVIF